MVKSPCFVVRLGWVTSAWIFCAVAATVAGFAGAEAALLKRRGLAALGRKFQIQSRLTIT